MQRCRRCFTRGKFCGHYDIHCRKAELGKPETFLDHAAQAISRHCIAGGFHRHGKTHASMLEPVGFDAQSEESVVNAPTTRIDRIELQLAAQAQFCAKT
jgi:hypothetical protein